jgi:hypothetical protein
MIHVMDLLTAIMEGKKPYSFVDGKRRELITKAVNLGIDCILKTQIKQNGKKTVWCAQHDEHTLEPAWARAYEPPSLSGSESVGVLRYLMSIKNPSDEIVEAIESGISWLENNSINGVRLERVRNPDGRTERKLISDINAKPLWARFYELETNRPLYLDRDSKFRYEYNEISYERRSGYSYHGYWASELLEKDYPLWRAKYGTSADEIPESTIIIEAEKGEFSGTVDRHSCWHNVMLSDVPHSTHSGRGLVDTKNEVGSYVEVAYKATWSGLHKITVRYTHIKSDPRPGELLVNGSKVKNLKLKQSNALPAWKTESVKINLKKGMNAIRLSALKDGGLPNIDYIKVAEIREVPEGRLPRIKVLEAEDGTYTGKEDHHSCWDFIAQTEAAHSGFTGEGYVDTYNKVGSYIEIKVDIKDAGEYNLGIRYVHGKPDVRPAEIKINEEIVKGSLPFSSTGVWTAWKTLTIPVKLKKGQNSIRLTAIGNQGLVNTDHFSLVPNF